MLGSRRIQLTTNCFCDSFEGKRGQADSRSRQRSFPRIQFATVYIHFVLHFLQLCTCTRTAINYW